jgi:hypothetical protein
MTRAEWFVVRSQGRWRNARVPRRCDCTIHTASGAYRCTTEIKAGDLHLDTNVVKDPKNYAARFTTKRYCYSCANALID